ncbi:MAG: hypothetical protein EBW87_02035 [Burkholderiaceae bacterium]|nr:hypothetical protein [Burkholderiaceae bacterium]
MIDKITQTFIKDYAEFMNGSGCGVLIQKKYVEQVDMPDVDDPGAMALGSFFEYHLSGALPKSGIIPQAVLMKNGDPTAEYRKAIESASLIKAMLQSYSLEIIQSGVKISDGKFEGTIDLIVEYTGSFQLEFENVVWNPADRFIIDLKYSGLVSETTPRYNKHGWQWSEAQKEYHGVQAKHYHYIGRLPFYFLVTQSNQKEGEKPRILFFYVPISQQEIDAHVSMASKYFDDFKRRSKLGFEPRPDYNRCSKCIWRNNCQEKHIWPHPVVVSLSSTE